MACGKNKPRGDERQKKAGPIAIRYNHPNGTELSDRRNGLQTYSLRSTVPFGPGIFVLPGLLKISRVSKPARKAGKKPNPFKPGEMMEVKARAAYNVVKVRPLKKLKEMV